MSSFSKWVIAILFGANILVWGNWGQEIPPVPTEQFISQSQPSFTLPTATPQAQEPEATPTRESHVFSAAVIWIDEHEGIPVNAFLVSHPMFAPSPYNLAGLVGNTSGLVDGDTYCFWGNPTTVLGDAAFDVTHWEPCQ